MTDETNFPPLTHEEMDRALDDLRMAMWEAECAFSSARESIAEIHHRWRQTKPKDRSTTMIADLLARVGNDVVARAAGIKAPGAKG